MSEGWTSGELLHERVSGACSLAAGEHGWNSRFIAAISLGGLVMLDSVPDGVPPEEWLKAPQPVLGQAGAWSGDRFLMLAEDYIKYVS